MSLRDAWIYALPAEWDALGTEEAPFSYAWSQAVTGYWLSSGLYEVYNVQAPQADIDAIVTALSDVEHVFVWEYAGSTGGTGYADGPPIYPVPTPVVGVMKPHITYDENGDPIGSIPATVENPNWGHVFFGQGERSFHTAPIEIVAQTTTGSSVGYDQSTAGTINPDYAGGHTVLKIETNPADGGTLIIQLQGPTVFSDIQNIAVGPIVLNAVDAVYTQLQSLWVWTGVLPFEFIAGEQYIVTVEVV
jgi:hypothetical protein